MKYTDARAVINALQVTELKVTNLPNTIGVHMETVYALLDVDEKTKAVRNTHGKCTAGAFGWSEQTQALLKDLLESMEADLIDRHFKVTKTDTKESEDDATGLESKRHTEQEEVDQL